MVIETRNHVVFVSGAMRVNQWPAIKAAVAFVLTEYQDRAILDFAGLTHLSEAGEAMFLDAIYDIEWLTLPLVLTNLSGEVRTRLEALAPHYFLPRLTDAIEARRIQQAIRSEAWWKRLWGNA